MAIIVRDLDVPSNCWDCDLYVACDSHSHSVEAKRPDHCPIIAMPEECMECVRTKFRAAIKCAEWAKMNAVINGQDYDVKCPMYWAFKMNTEDKNARDSDAIQHGKRIHGESQEGTKNCPMQGLCQQNNC